MRIIDRYLLQEFLKVFIICWVSLTGLYVVFDAFSNLDEFMEAAEEEGDLLGMMGEYYAYRSIFFFDRTSAMLSMIAAMFTVTWIQRHNELTALMGAGISRLRVVVPIIVAAVSISIFSAANRELVIPQLREQLSQNPHDLRGDKPQEAQPRYDNNTDILLQGTFTFANEQRIHRANFVLPPPLDACGKHLVAQDAYYQPPRAGRPGGYLLRQVTEPAELLKQPTLLQRGRPAVITPRDAPGWLAADECFVVSDVTFEQIAGGTTWQQFASTADLIEGLQNPSLDFGADARVSIHSRIVQPFLDVTLLFLGLPLVLTRETRNMYLAIGMCVALVVAFMLVVMACQYLGAVYLLAPALAAWLPVIIFVPTAVALFDRIER